MRVHGLLPPPLGADLAPAGADPDVAVLGCPQPRLRLVARAADRLLYPAVDHAGLRVDVGLWPPRARPRVVPRRCCLCHRLGLTRRRKPATVMEPHLELMREAMAADGAAQRALLAGESAEAGFGRAAELYRASWEEAPAASYGRLIGMLK